jgi:RND family efflux transporter MFP subunit
LKITNPAEAAVDANAVEKAEEKGKTNKPLKIKKKGKKKKAAVLLLLLAAAAAAAFYALNMGKGADAPAKPVDTDTLKRMDVADMVTISGTVEGSNTAKVMSASEYEITSIPVSVGDHVMKGQALANLNVESLREQYRKAVTNLDASKYSYEATKKLYAEGAASEQDYVKAETAYNSDLITVNSFDIGSKSKINSPISGTVTRVNASIGSKSGNMAAGEALFVIEDLSNLKMKVRVAEIDISKIREGQEVSISSSMLGDKKALGVVGYIAPTGEKKDSASSEMVIPVEIKITEPNGLIAGVTGKAQILIQKSENTLAAPIDAILEDPTTHERKIFVLRGDGTLQGIPVTLGVQGLLSVEIIADGVKEGDTVVLSPSFDLTDGLAATAAAKD